MNAHATQTPPSQVGVPLSDYTYILGTPRGRAIVHEIDLALVAIATDECLTTALYKGSLQFRHDGAKRRVSVRSLYWLHKFGAVPLFGKAICGTEACLNPEHQNVLRSDRYSPGTLGIGLKVTQIAQISTEERP